MNDEASKLYSWGPPKLKKLKRKERKEEKENADFETTQFMGGPYDIGWIYETIK